jgi:hypothetical protein
MLVNKGSAAAAASPFLSTPTFLLFNWSASIPSGQTAYFLIKTCIAFSPMIVLRGASPST